MNKEELEQLKKLLHRYASWQSEKAKICIKRATALKHEELFKSFEYYQSARSRQSSKNTALRLIDEVDLALHYEDYNSGEPQKV